MTGLAENAPDGVALPAGVPCARSYPQLSPGLRPVRQERAAAGTAIPRLGSATLGRLPRGIVEPWGEQRAYDQVYFYRLLR